MTNDEVAELRLVTMIVYVIVSPPFGSLLSTLFMMDRLPYGLVVVEARDDVGVIAGIVEEVTPSTEPRSVEDASSLPPPSADVEVAIEDVDTEDPISVVEVGVVEVLSLAMISVEVGVEVAAARSGVDVARVDDGASRSVSDATIELDVEEEICAMLSSADARRSGPLNSDRKKIAETMIVRRRVLEDVIFA